MMVKPTEMWRRDNRAPMNRGAAKPANAGGERSGWALGEWETPLRQPVRSGELRWVIDADHRAVMGGFVEQFGSRDDAG